jgi:hypothetical protein
MEFYKAIAMRFLKGFLAGGFGAISSQLALGIAVHSVEELKIFLISLVAAFVSGGTLALQKMLSWKNESEA